MLPLAACTVSGSPWEKMSIIYAESKYAWTLLGESQTRLTLSRYKGPGPARGAMLRARCAAQGEECHVPVTDELVGHGKSAGSAV